MTGPLTPARIAELNEWNRGVADEVEELFDSHDALSRYLEVAREALRDIAGTHMLSTLHDVGKMSDHARAALAKLGENS